MPELGDNIKATRPSPGTLRPLDMDRVAVRLHRRRAVQRTAAVVGGVMALAMVGSFAAALQDRRPPDVALVSSEPSHFPSAATATEVPATDHPDCGDARLPSTAMPEPPGFSIVKMEAVRPEGCGDGAGLNGVLAATGAGEPLAAFSAAVVAEGWREVPCVTERERCFATDEWFVAATTPPNAPMWYPEPVGDGPQVLVSVGEALDEEATATATPRAPAIHTENAEKQQPNKGTDAERTQWVIVVAAANDPNDLEEEFNALGVRANLSPAGCYTGLPTSVEPSDYAILIYGWSRAELEEAVQGTPHEDREVHKVTTWCLD
jgi:hypothetical protein